MQRIKKLTALILSILTLSSVFVFGGTVSASASGTGAGLAEWALNAYYEGWEYVYGGTSYGSVDCSGLIYLYCGGSRCDMYYTATESGSVSAGIPRVHGLGLYHPGHVGVYIGDGMAVDARSSYDDMCYQSVSSYGGWYYWFKLAAVNYTENGWEEFNGNYYYYENGEYIVNTSRTIDGTTYYFDSTGISSATPSSSSSSSSYSSSSTTATEPKYPTYRNGSSGSEVENIQERLAELGYYTGAISGTFDDATESAYRAFQTQAGVIVDGISGSDREVLYSDDAPYAPVEETTTPQVEEETTVEETENKTLYQIGDESEEVKKIQEQLTKLGYFDGEISGTFGDYTEQMIKNFQLANGISATGIIDEETYALIFADATEATTESATEGTTEATESTTQSGPIQMPVTTAPTDLIVTNQQNQTYTDTASQVVKKTNTVTKRALSKSSSVIPSATTAQVKRTANIWIWFVLVAVIMGSLAGVYFLSDKKARRYARYTARKKKRMAKADVNTRW